MELTKEIAYQAIAEFFTEKPFVLFATGTSCALDLNFGMPALERHLRAELAHGMTEAQAQQWQQVVSALDASTHDFESAMDFIKDDALTNRIVELTASFVANHDNTYAHSIMSGSCEWPAGLLVKKLVEALPQADKQLHVATPNYDLLAEYAFVQHKIPYITGFHGGFLRRYDWNQAKKSVQSIQKGLSRSRQTPRVVECKHIRLHKPHGSLNTFEWEAQLIECNSWILNKPEGVVRAMITPGTAKYQRLHKDRAQLAEYDTAVGNHTRFLFLGFGFNDSQLVNNVFRQKLEQDQCQALLITRSSNPRIEEWLQKCPNMWLICKQTDSDKSRIYNTKFKNWLHIDDKELWRFNDFTNEFLGG
ncbi:MAG: SIR2 family protein [Methyloprofundus sp.]|nr:SIR2 family protein [Methyloprofundus sp.]